jgi:hypothetical protein
MIPTKDNGVRVEGGLAAVEATSMGIAPGQEEFVVNALSNLYSDKEMAVLREYAANALDATLEAAAQGQTFRPIEVTLPSWDKPYLSIKDWGVGLTHDDIRRIYSQYGASTKRDSNDQTGLFGFGSKAGLTYTAAFTVTSVRDGIRIRATVEKTPGLPVMKVIETETTTDPNGTEVTLIARTFNTFERKAARLFRFWDKGTVLVNGVEPDRITGLKLTDDVLVIDDDQSYVQMGSVAYPVKDEDLDLGLVWGKRVLVKVPIGSVEPTPSREALHMTDTTKRTLAGVREAFEKKASTAVQENIDAAKTHPEALEALRNWTAIWDRQPKAEYTYEGKPLPIEVHCEGMRLVNRFNYHKKSDARKTPVFQASQWGRTIWITGYLPDNFTAHTRKKLEKWAEDNNLDDSYEYFALVPPKYEFSATLCADVERKDWAFPDAKWLRDDTIIPWATIKAVKLPRKGGGRGGSAGRIPGSYDVIKDGAAHYEMEADKLPRTRLYYIQGNMSDGQRATRTLDAMKKKYVCVCLPMNRVDKFLRTFPKAKPVHDLTKALKDKWLKSLTADDKLWMTMQRSSDARKLQHIDPDRVDDPALKGAARVYATKHPDLYEQANLFGWQTVTWKNPLSRYPLFTEGYYATRYMEDVYLYMNAKHALEKNK